MLKFVAMLAMLILADGQPARADSNVASLHMAEAQLVGKARLKYLAWSVYDAELYAPKGQWRADQPFALTLNYLRAFTAKELAQSSVDEMRKQGYNNEAILANWQRQLESILPNVSARTTITGVRDRNGHAVFYRNGSRIGSIKNREFARRFFDIWLGSRVSYPGIRNKLIGNS